MKVAREKIVCTLNESSKPMLCQEIADTIQLRNKTASLQLGELVRVGLVKQTIRGGRVAYFIE